MGKETLGQLLATNTINDPYMAAAIFNKEYPAIHKVDTQQVALITRCLH